MGFKTVIDDRLTILKVNILEKILIDISNVLDAWISVIFAIVWIVFYIIFINALYSNIHTIVGYTKDQMLLFALLSQINFYCINVFTSESLLEMIASVRTGNLDLILSKPLPSLFYTTFKKIDIIFLVINLIPGIVPLIIYINWGNLSFNFFDILSGIWIIICGQIAMNFFQFMTCIPVFWRGSAEHLFSLSWVFEYNLGRTIPYEGLNDKFKVIFTAFIPVMIATALSTSVILGKFNAISAILITTIIAIVSLLLKMWVWKLCLRNYTSASS